MRNLAITMLALALIGCGGPTWPAALFPPEVEVERTLFAEGDGLGFRENCEAVVVEITEESARRVISLRPGENGAEVVPPSGWRKTPVSQGPEHSLYSAAFGGCNDETGVPLGDLHGALMRPGAFYKIVDGGAGIGIVIPRARLAGYFYFG